MDELVFLETNVLIDLSAEPEQWTLEAKAPIPVDYGGTGFCLIQYKRRIFLFGGYEGNADGSASTGSDEVRIYYIDEDR